MFDHISALSAILIVSDALTTPV